MAIKDLRHFIEIAEKSRDLVRVREEVDWDSEAGAMVRLSNENKGQALLFEKLKDYSPDYRLLGAPLATFRRLALALGMKAETPLAEIHAEYGKRIAHPIKPLVVKKAPCQENVMQGEDIDLFKFPVPLIHDGDGGRFVGSWHIVIIKDPDSDWINWGMYRSMVHNRRWIGGAWHPGNDGGKIFLTKYLARGKPMPVSIAIGADPLCSFMALAPFKFGESEVDYASALHQEPVELVKSLTNDLLVPANAEIILEGEAQLERGMQEGPFGEYTGYRTSTNWQRPCRLKAITFRSKPILTFTNMGIPHDDSSVCWSLATASFISRELKEFGILHTGVYCPPEMANLLVIVGMDTWLGNNAIKVKNFISSTHLNIPKVMVVDKDVDIYNLTEVWHAFAAKCHPSRGIRVMESEPISPLIPFLDPEERKWGRGATALFDCTWPVEWRKNTDVPPRISFKETYSRELQESSLKKWAKLGLG